MKLSFGDIIKFAFLVLFTVLIYEFYVFIGEYRNHDRYYPIQRQNETSPSALFDKRTGNLYTFNREYFFEDDKDLRNWILRVKIEEQRKD